MHYGKCVINILLEEKRENLTMKKMIQFLNSLMIVFTGMFIGHAVSLWRNIEFYKTLSIPWHEDIIYWGTLWVLELAVCMIIKHFIKKHADEE